MAKKTSKPAKKTTKTPLRFAHPFFTAVPVGQRSVISGAGSRMTDYVQTKLLPIPDPLRDPVMLLDEIIGEAGRKQIEQAGSITFHTLGDSGHENGLNQEMVAEAMAGDFDITHPEKSPAFLLHLGDVIYYDNTDKGYQAQFYVPYKNYPGKIIAIPGNHDGELFKYDGTPTGQKETLTAFQRNFCQPKPGIPPDAGTIYREMVAQPGVYWWLNAPLVDIIGLYSNIGEGPGFISDKTIGQAQKSWLVKTLTKIRKARTTGAAKALIIAVHHPPFSNGGHSSSSIMLADIDDACTQAELLPDAVLAAHSHNYQRFTRFHTLGKQEHAIPYYVIGTGGRGLNPVSKATGVRTGDHSFENALMGYGYLSVTATAKNIDFAFTQVDNLGKKIPFDKVIRLDLTTHQLT